MAFITKRIWLSMFCVLIIFLMIGGFIFQALEQPGICEANRAKYENELKAEERSQKIKCKYEMRKSVQYK